MLEIPDKLYAARESKENIIILFIIGFPSWVNTYPVFIIRLVSHDALQDEIRKKQKIE